METEENKKNKNVKNEKKEKLKITQEEKEFLESIPKKYKFIMRNELGVIYVSEKKPKFNQKLGIMHTSRYKLYHIDRNLFKFLTFDNRKVWSIRRLLKREVSG